MQRSKGENVEDNNLKSKKIPGKSRFCVLETPKYACLVNPSSSPLLIINSKILVMKRT